MRRVRTMGWALVALVAGCGGEHDGDAAVTQLRVGEPVLEVEDDVCVAWRQVVRRTTEGNCTTVTRPNSGGSWQGTKLFPAWSGTNAKYGAYCVYEFSNPTAVTSEDVAYLASRTFVAESGADCVVTTPASVPALEQELDPALDALADDRMDLLTDAELGLPGTNNNRTAVRVAVLDTVPATWNQPRDNHGVVVADLIAEIAHACLPNAPGCKAWVENVLALPRYGLAPGDKDQVRGGMRAFQSEIAGALYSTIRSWETGAPAKLVLNMSFGWLAAFGEDPAASAPAVDAVLLALRRASCEGALAIAAAGNDQTDCTPGPVLPAAWEELPAPTVQQCTSQLDIANPVASSGQYRPLVHAVGGLTWDDDPVSNARELGRPRLGAIADHVPRVLREAPARTGSSISAAVVSGAAALVWSYNPGLDAHRVMDQLYAAGIATNDDAEFGLAGTTHPIRRITACSALAQACTTTGTCPAAVQPVCRTTWLGPEDLALAIEGVDPGTEVTPGLTSVGSCAGFCDASYELYTADGVAASCPALPGTSDTEDLTRPQPTNPACPTCTWTSTGSPTNNDYQVSIVAALDVGWGARTDTSMSVSLKLENGTSVAYALGDQNLSTATKTITLTSIPQSKVVSGTVRIGFVGSGVATDWTHGDLVTPPSTLSF